MLRGQQELTDGSDTLLEGVMTLVLDFAQEVLIVYAYFRMNLAGGLPV